GRIEHFKLTDLVVLASVVGAQFGNGGGGEVENAVPRLALHERFGPQRGERVWESFRAQNDPESISTLHDGRSFPYGGTPEHPRGVALPDPGSVTEQRLVFDERGSAQQRAADTTPSRRPATAPARDLTPGEAA